MSLYHAHCTMPPNRLFGKPLFKEIMGLSKKICSPTQFDHPHPKDLPASRGSFTCVRWWKWTPGHQEKSLCQQGTKRYLKGFQGQMSDTRSCVKEKNWTRKKMMEPYSCNQAKKCYVQLGWSQAFQYLLSSSAQWGLSEFESEACSVWFWCFIKSRHKNVCEQVGQSPSTGIRNESSPLFWRNLLARQTKWAFIGQLLVIQDMQSLTSWKTMKHDRRLLDEEWVN